MVIPMFSPLFPLLLLLLSFLSLLWYQKTDNDIFKALAVSSLIFAIIWGLILVHWSIHLLGLLLLLKFRSPAFSCVRVPRW
ncbi:conserved hypothetical protein [Microcystis aeruginosa PCC 9809]|uniref:Uncharacterized protein n=2 Tax=Microcystis aeruginosa TaxID=1126 RepID=I4HT34_MICAE|nr:hypothetical protein [Microcystis aeruginosa]NCQ99467.1 hypothetical protein [Microcystis aeruginosa L211-11]NCR30930.1 hypothetical protein [Microcystis aeruginosa L211-101]REJ45130.1 MAG: hypothetical protein DWQ53_15335 [Microcystis flos-aquae DF17]BAG04650.1 hypothetical protein MAE_48280 [Microcystis aeruginosa NIES-843]CCI25208.1 conserved hypothetical protein [Microcystis aeruginosa PCC 9809]